MVKSLTVTFDRHRDDRPRRVRTRATGRKRGRPECRRRPSSNGRTVAVLTFTGPGIIGGSLADGNYALTIRGDRVRDLLGQELDGDGDGTAGGDRADGFPRLFGDSDGDRDVDLQDLGRFLSTFGRRPGIRTTWPTST